MIEAKTEQGMPMPFVPLKPASRESLKGADRMEEGACGKNSRPQIAGRAVYQGAKPGYR